MPGPRDIAGRRYALAILEIARADQSFDAWIDAVEGLEALTAQSSYVEALQADGMTDEAFVAIVDRVVPGIGEKQRNLFRLLRRKSRLGLGASIASFFRELVDEERHVLRVQVTSAVALTDGQRTRLAERIGADTGYQVEIDTETDESLVGGLTVRIGDRLIDGSTRTRLRNLRGQLERAAL